MSSGQQVPQRGALWAPWQHYRVCESVLSVVPHPLVCSSSISLQDLGTFIFSSIWIPQIWQQIKQHSLWLFILLLRYNFLSIILLNSFSFCQLQVFNSSYGAPDPRPTLQLILLLQANLVPLKLPPHCSLMFQEFYKKHLQLWSRSSGIIYKLHSSKLFSCSGLTLLNSLKDHLVFSVLCCLTPPDGHCSWSAFLVCGVDFAPGNHCRWSVTSTMLSDWHRFSKPWYMSQDESLLFREGSWVDDMGCPLESNKIVWFFSARIPIGHSGH